MAEDHGKLEATDGKEHGKSSKGATKGAKDVPGKGKQGSFFQKYKTWIIVGGLFLLVVLYFLLRGKSSSSAANTAATDPTAGGAVDPSTGYLTGSPADNAALGSSGSVGSVPGPTGDTGATGATGAKGPAGKTMTLWGLATELAEKRFHTKNPTHKEINTERSHLLGVPGAPKPKPHTQPKHVNPGGPKK